LHDTRKSTVPSDPFTLWVPCSCALVTLPFNSSNKEKAHSTTVALLPVILTLRLLLALSLPSMVVLLVQRVNLAAAR